MKHFFFDLDGTLFENNNGFDGQAIAILKLIEKSGAKYSFTTGRAKMYVDYLLGENDKIECDPVTVSYGEGGLVLNFADRRTILEKPFHDEDVESFLNDEKLIKYLFFMTDTCMTSRGAILENTSSAYPVWRQGESLERVWMMHLRHISQELFDYIVKTYDFKICKNYGGTDLNVDVGPKDISKGKALELVIEDLNLDRKEVFVFGDSYNDISNFEVEGVFSVAMYKSLDKLKDRANYVLNEEESLLRVVANILDGGLGH